MGNQILWNLIKKNKALLHGRAAFPCLLMTIFLSVNVFFYFYYFTINSILNPIIRKYKRTGFIRGFRFLITGRLTRKERATHLLKSYKAMPYASPSIVIDHASDFKIMRFGVVGIKISLLSISHTPYHYFFQFKNQL